MTAKDLASVSAPFNIASLLGQTAKEQPYKRAVVAPAGRDRAGRVAYAQLTFRQLDRYSDTLAHGLQGIGIGRGIRTVLMVRPGIDFFALTFALFKVGAIPVVVDPGMGVARMVRCLRTTRPEAFIGVPLAHCMRLIFRKDFRSVRAAVSVGTLLPWGGTSLAALAKQPAPAFTMAATRRDETAAILFTTGSTGPARGALYTHGNFAAQIETIRSHFAIGGDEIDLPTFPLFALFDPALGMTAVIPEMDPTRPAQANPERIFEAILNQGVTNLFASPALLRRLGDWGTQRGVRLPCLRRVVSAGAPVAADVIETFGAMLPEGCEVHTPYGATEAVPVSSIASGEILADTRRFSDQGFGICVGRALPGIELRTIAIADAPIARWSETLPVAEGEIGEIAVRGPLVTRGYYDNAQSDQLSKIPCEGGSWHRMGDLGWLDKKGRLWFCGRKSQRVITARGTLYTIPCEAIFNRHPAVLRSALVGVGPTGSRQPVICVQLRPDRRGIDRAQLGKELLALAKQNELTRDIGLFLVHPGFPVDVRHNAKIFRETLAAWAATQLPHLPQPLAAAPPSQATDEH